MSNELSEYQHEAFQKASRCDRLVAQNKALREALERIATFSSRFGPSDEALIAKDALALAKELTP